MVGPRLFQRPLVRVVTTCFLVVCGHLAAAGVARAAELHRGLASERPRHAGFAFLDSSLNRLVSGGVLSVDAAESARVDVAISDDGTKVKVSFLFFDERSADGARLLLPGLGAEVTASYRRLVDAWVPITRLAEVGTLPGLMIAHRPFPPFQAEPAVAVSSAAAGTVVTEGVAASGADAWHGTGADGTGVTVGIIDSFNGYNTAATAGEVPAAFAVGALDSSNLQGTACAEIVHDMAPGADLVLASATTTTEAASRIAALAAFGADVVSSSKEYITPDAPPYVGPGREPGDGSSALCQAISDARSSTGTLFVQAAGNHAMSHWDGTFVDTNRNFYHEFTTGVEVNQIALGTSSIATFLRWDDWPASSQDYDLELWVKDGIGVWEFVAISQNVQSGTQPPWEYIQSALNPLSQYGLRIKKYGATRSVYLDLMDMYQATFEFAVAARSLVDVAACPDALVVAALDVHNPEYPVKSNSSQGPTYGPGGIPTGGLDQPRIAAYASVDTLTFGDDAFTGTSAATPHVAGAAALVLQQQPFYSPDDVQAFLEARAIDVASTPPGYDHQAGHGRLALGNANPCTYELSPLLVEVPFAGGEGSFEISTLAGCPWEAISSDEWLAVTELSGSGSSSVSYTAAANGGAARSATITVGDGILTVNQAAAPCTYELSALSASMPADGGEGSVAVTTNLVSCEWTAVASDTWITITGGASGPGDGAVSFTVAANEGEARTGTITIAALTFTVDQAAAACALGLDPAGVSMSAAGGEASIGVTANLASCEWTAVSNDAWITVTGGASGVGPGTISYSVAANDGEARTGSLTIGDRTFVVEQAAAPCTYELSALAVAMAAAGGDGSVVVMTNLASCEWTAASNEPWITVTGGATGAGSGTVIFLVAANAGEARSGTLTIAGQPFTVEQAAAPCAYELSTLSALVPAVGGPGSVGVTANLVSCAWAAVSNAAWITVTGDSAFTGSGTVTFSIAVNAGDERLGTITIAGQTFTVDQAAVPCEFQLTALSASFTAAGGSGNAGVTANIGSCGWTAVSQAAWLTLTGASAGTGSGAVAFSVDANAGAARTGTITIAGQTFTVLQGAAGCSYSLYSWSSSFFAEGGSGQTRVWANLPSCTWNSISNAPPWLTITVGEAGTGSDFVDYLVAPNPGLARQGTLTIAGRTYTVSQAGAPCIYGLSASGAEIGAGGGTGSVGVTASNPTCPWTAVSSAAEWLSVTAGTPGAGNGTVSFAVGVNTGDIRTATLTIGGKTFTLTQASPPCTYGITPGAASFPALGGGGTVSVSTAFASCAWTAASNAPWLTVTAGAAGTGAGTAAYSVADNPGEPRSGTLTVAGYTFTVTQEEHGTQVHRKVKRMP